MMLVLVIIISVGIAVQSEMNAAEQPFVVQTQTLPDKSVQRNLRSVDYVVNNGSKTVPPDLEERIVLASNLPGLNSDDSFNSDASMVSTRNDSISNDVTNNTNLANNTTDHSSDTESSTTTLSTTSTTTPTTATSPWMATTTTSSATSDTTLEQTDITDTTLEQTNITDTTLEQTDITDTTLEQTDITDTTLDPSDTTTTNETTEITSSSTISSTDTTSVSTEESTSATTPTTTTARTTSTTSSTDTTSVSTEESTSATTSDTTSTTSSTDTTSVSTEESTSATTPTTTTARTTSAITSTVTTSVSTVETTTLFPVIERGLALEIVSGIIGILLVVGLLATAAVMYRNGKLTCHYKNSNANVRPQPISLSKFENHCDQLLDTPARLGSEFQLLQTLSTDVADMETFAAAQLPDNRKKNRYVNILPYDATRVKLNITNDDPSSDYINASLIKGYSKTIEYIASQGPKEDTIPDFFRMIYQHNVNVIVMVTNFEEGGKMKCDPYLPKLREQLVAGDFIVQCSTELHFPMHVQRTIVLYKDDKKRSVIHLHFKEWPDFGCPEGTDSMLQFTQTLRYHVSNASRGLVLVHCSAGVGRTGTLIAVDILLQHIQESKKVDVFGTVFKLRKQRTNMVQTMGQYAYIYKCIKDAIVDPSFLKKDNSQSNSTEPIYGNIPTKLTTFLYETLPKLKPKSTSSESDFEL